MIISCCPYKQQLADAAVDSAYRYAYDFDDIGNRKTSEERGSETSYFANMLNQYTEITSQTSKTFQTSFDADGNQTLVKTETGIWSVTYNGENRPILWTCLTNLSNVSNLSNLSNIITMSYDRMGRRVTKNDQRFVYNGYLQIANHHSSTSHFNYYIWDP